MISDVVYLPPADRDMFLLLVVVEKSEYSTMKRLPAGYGVCGRADTMTPLIADIVSCDDILNFVSSADSIYIIVCHDDCVSYAWPEKRCCLTFLRPESWSGSCSDAP